MRDSQTPRFSVHLHPGGPVAQVVELARHAETVGALRCWVNDEGLATRDPFVTLTAVAASTDRLLLGPGIVNPYSRHPGATVGAIASLDEFSGGRAFLGLGAGGTLSLGPLRMERLAPVRSVDRMIRTSRALLAGETVTEDDPVVGFIEARLDYGRPDLEIIVAGRGLRMLAVAGDQADGANLGYLHKSLIGDAVARLRAAAGPRPFTVTYTTMLVRNDAEMTAARAGLSFRLVDSPPEVRALLGLDVDRVEDLRAALRRGGPATAASLVEEGWVDQFMIVGDTSACRSELLQLLDDNDLDEFQLPVPDLDQGGELIDVVAPWF